MRNWLTLVAIATFLMSGCVKQPTHEPTPAPTPPVPADQTAGTVNDLKITAFGIFPADNDRIYIPIRFIEQSGTQYIFSGTREITGYQTGLTALKASFTSNAAKVTIGSTEQTSGTTVNNFTGPVTYRFYAKDGDYKEYTVEVTNPAASYSGLPLLVLTTDGGTEIKSKEVWTLGKIRIDKQAQDVTEYDGATNIRGRGHITWSMPKKPYALQLINKDPLLGMPKQKRWAVLANYGDKTLLRNRVSFEIAKRMDKLGWVPDTRYVEVIVNGVYQGNYLLTEQIRRDPNRVNIKETDDKATGDDITGGYLIEVDRYNKAESGCIFPTRSDLPVLVKDPEPMNTDQRTYITDYLNSVEALLYKTVPDLDEYGALIDVDSFIDYWILCEITANRDIRLPGSAYMYKDVNGKLFAGPVWDYDLTTFIGRLTFVLADYDPQPGSVDWDTNGYRPLWFGKLFKDPKFVAKTKARWNTLYNGGAGVFSMDAFIDQQAAYIQKSAGLNWKPTGLWAPNNSTMNTDEQLEWSAAVEQLKAKVKDRLTVLNKLIEKL